MSGAIDPGVPQGVASVVGVAFDPGVAFVHSALEAAFVPSVLVVSFVPFALEVLVGPSVLVVPFGPFDLAVVLLAFPFVRLVVSVASDRASGVSVVAFPFDLAAASFPPVYPHSNSFDPFDLWGVPPYTRRCSSRSSLILGKEDKKLLSDLGTTRLSII